MKCTLALTVIALSTVCANAEKQTFLPKLAKFKALKGTIGRIFKREPDEDVALTETMNEREKYRQATESLDEIERDVEKMLGVLDFHTKLVTPPYENEIASLKDLHNQAAAELEQKSAELVQIEEAITGKRPSYIVLVAEGPYDDQIAEAAKLSLTMDVQAKEGVQSMCKQIKDKYTSAAKKTQDHKNVNSASEVANALTEMHPDDRKDFSERKAKEAREERKDLEKKLEKEVQKLKKEKKDEKKVEEVMAWEQPSSVLNQYVQ